jgi:hypothetical protein
VMSRNIYLYVTKKDAHPEIFVWPTVVTGEFSVAIKSGQIYDLAIYNTAGKIMKEKAGCQYKTTLNISDFTSGVYILTVSGNNFRKSVKIIRN